MDPRSSKHVDPTECGIVWDLENLGGLALGDEKEYKKQESPVKGGLSCSMGGHVAGEFCLQILDEIWVTPPHAPSTLSFRGRLLPWCHSAYVHHPSLGKAPCWTLAPMAVHT